MNTITLAEYVSPACIQEDSKLCEILLEHESIDDFLEYANVYLDSAVDSVYTKEDLTTSTLLDYFIDWLTIPFSEFVYKLLKIMYKDRCDILISINSDYVFVQQVYFSANNREKAMEFIIKTMKENIISFNDLTVFCTKTEI